MDNLSSYASHRSWTNRPVKRFARLFLCRITTTKPHRIRYAGRSRLVFTFLSAVAGDN